MNYHQCDMLELVSFLGANNFGGVGVAVVLYAKNVKNE